MGLKTLIYHWAEKEKKRELTLRRTYAHQSIMKESWGVRFISQSALHTRGNLQLFIFPCYLPKA